MFDPATPANLLEIVGGTNVLNSRFFEAPLSIAFNDMKRIINVAAMFIASREYLHAIILHGHHAENRFAYLPVSRYERLNCVDVCSGDATQPSPSLNLIWPGLQCLHLVRRVGIDQDHLARLIRRTSGKQQCNGHELEQA